MPPSKEGWVARYRTERPRYERFTGEVRELLRKLLSHESIKATIETRTKDVDSFAAKITRPGKTYTNPLSEVSDLAGLRIIVGSLSDVERVAQLLRSEFAIDAARSINKADVLDPDRFGYLSQHFIVFLSHARRSLAEWSGLGELCAEIQVRTALQHAWSVIQHPLDYKSTIDVPKPLRRRLFRLSALFELADAELDQLLIEAGELRARYAAEAVKTPSSLPIDLDSLRAYIDTSEQVAYWDRFWNSIPNTKTEAASWSDRDVLMPLACGLRSLRDYDSLLQQSRGWGEKFVEDTLLSIRGSPGTALSTTKNGILMYLLISNYPDVLTTEILRSKYGFGRPEPTIEIAKQRNPRFHGGKNV